MPVIHEAIQSEDSLSDEDEVTDKDLPKTAKATIESFGTAMATTEAVKDSDALYEDEDSVSESDPDIALSDVEDFPVQKCHPIPGPPSLRAQHSALSRKKPGPKPRYLRDKSPCLEDEIPDPKTCGKNSHTFFHSSN